MWRVFTCIHICMYMWLHALTRALLTTLKSPRQESLSRHSPLCSSRNKARSPFPPQDLCTCYFTVWVVPPSSGLMVDSFASFRPRYRMSPPWRAFSTTLSGQKSLYSTAQLSSSTLVDFFRSTLKICKDLCLCPSNPCQSQDSVALPSSTAVLPVPGTLHGT